MNDDGFEEKHAHIIAKLQQMGKILAPENFEIEVMTKISGSPENTFLQRRNYLPGIITLSVIIFAAASMLLFYNQPSKYKDPSPAAGHLQRSHVKDKNVETIIRGNNIIKNDGNSSVKSNLKTKSLINIPVGNSGEPIPSIKSIDSIKNKKTASNAQKPGKASKK